MNQSLQRYPVLELPKTPVIERLFTHQVASRQKPALDELARFRQEMEDPDKSYELPVYQAKKESILLYRGVFALFALFFYGLAWFVYNCNPSGLTQHIYENSLLLQKCSIAFASLIGTTAAVASYVMNPERETISHLIKKARERILVTYKHEMAAIGSWKALLFSQSAKKFLLLKKAWSEAQHNIDHFKNESIQLLRSINDAKHVEKERLEKLRHEALVEFDHKLTQLVRDFEELF
jgi:hypothetical protein